MNSRRDTTLVRGAKQIQRGRSAPRGVTEGKCTGSECCRGLPGASLRPDPPSLRWIPERRVARRTPGGRAARTSDNIRVPGVHRIAGHPEARRGAMEL